MRKRQLFCNAVTYNTLINACSSTGDLVTAERIMQSMKNNDINECQPDVISYSALIKGFCSQGHISRGFELYSEMESRGIQPDAIVFNTLLEGCSKKNEVQAIEDVLLKTLKRWMDDFNFNFELGIHLINHF